MEKEVKAKRVKAMGFSANEGSEDLRTDLEKRWEDFEEYLKATCLPGEIREKLVAIKFAGDDYEVKFLMTGEADGEKIVTLEVVGETHGLESARLAFNMNRLEFDDTEFMGVISE